MKIRHIALFYGHIARNVGDIAINTGEINLLRAAYPDAKIDVVLLRTRVAANLETSLESFGTRENINFINITDADQNPVRFALDPVSWLDTCGVAGADLLVLAAGEHLFSYAGNANERNLFWRTLPALAARLAGKACLVMPSTFGPFETEQSRDLIEALVSSEAVRVATREPRSVDVLAELVPARPVKAMLDPAFFLQKPKPADRTGRKRTIGLVMRSENWGIRLAARDRTSFRSNDPALFDEDLGFQFSLAYARKVLKESDCVVDVFIQTDADKAIVETLVQTLGEEGWADRIRAVTVITVEEYLEALDALDFVVASRFHALIMGMVCGKPGFGLYFGVHGHKIPGLMDLTGFPGQSIDLLETPVGDAVATVFEKSVGEQPDFQPMADHLDTLRRQTTDWMSADWSEIEPAAALSAPVSDALLRMATELVDQNASAKAAQHENDLSAQARKYTSLEKKLQRTEDKLRKETEQLETIRAKLRKSQENSRKHSAQAYALKKSVDKLETKVSRFSAEIQDLRKKIEKIRASASYRIGRELVSIGDTALKLTRLPERGLKHLSDVRKARNWEAQLKKLEAAAASGGLEAVVKQVETAYPDDITARSEALVEGARHLSEKGFSALEFDLIKYAARTNPCEYTLRQQFWAAKRATDLRTGWASLSALKKLFGPDPLPRQTAFMERAKRNAAYQMSLLEEVPDAPLERIEPVEGRVCYCLHNSLPYSSGGYAARAHGLVLGLKAAGQEVTVLTRPGFPIDNLPELDPKKVPLKETIDGIDYRRLLEPRRQENTAADYMQDAADVLTEQFRQIRPSLVMAASNYQTALPALIAARRLGIPFFYEIRGFWEITRLSREPEFAGTPGYWIQEILEAETALRADHVFTLTDPMRKEIVRRGVPQEKITLLPNSCEPERFAPMARDTDLAEQWGIAEGVPVIGYIGTFAQYEGLDLLVQAAAELKDRGHDFRLMLVGSENVSGGVEGPVVTEIRRIAAERDIEDRVLLPGRVPHEDVPSYYSLMDITPFPRKSQPVTEMVSPMKPLEAYSMEKAVVASNVAALAEMVQHEHTGMLFEKGDVQSLADALEALLKDPEKRQRLGKAGRAWVEENRTWTTTTKIALDVFNRFVPAREPA